MRTPRRPPVKPHYEARETEFVTQLLAETGPVSAPAPVRAAAQVDDDDDDEIPWHMRDDAPMPPPPRDAINAPVRLHTRRLK